VRHPRPDTDPAPRFGSIRLDETLPMREAARRMGWASRMSAEVQRMGLKTVTIGRLKYTTGLWVRDFVERMAERTAGQEGHVDG
jgi:hypothetical protein